MTVKGEKRLQKLTFEDAQNIREEYKRVKVTYQTLADKYGVSVNNICGIIKGRSFRTAEMKDEYDDLFEKLRVTSSKVTQLENKVVNLEERVTELEERCDLYEKLVKQLEKEIDQLKENKDV